MLHPGVDESFVCAVQPLDGLFPDFFQCACKPCTLSDSLSWDATQNVIIQDDEARPRHQLVAYCGEDWAALSAADVGYDAHI